MPKGEWQSEDKSGMGSITTCGERKLCNHSTTSSHNFFTSFPPSPPPKKKTKKTKGTVTPLDCTKFAPPKSLV